MSRARGGGGRGRGRGGGAGGLGGLNLPAGITFEDVMLARQARDPTPLYPAFPDLPTLTNISEREREICKLQMGFSDRLKRSPYYLVDTAKAQKPNQVQRYSDRYNVVASQRPALQAKDFEPKLFPKNVWTDYFEGKKRADKKQQRRGGGTQAKFLKLNLDALENAEAVDEGDEDGNKEMEGDEDAQALGDYDEDDEEFGDDDYVNNYFEAGDDNGDDDYGGDDDGGGGD